jgi:hypothetical protein
MMYCKQQRNARAAKKRPWAPFAEDVVAETLLRDTGFVGDDLDGAEMVGVEVGSG